MRVKIVLGLDGSMVAAIDNEQGATFEEATAKLEMVKALIGDVPLVMVGGVERHVHGPDGQHVHVAHEH